MEGHCSTGQSPQWAVVPMDEEEEECKVLGNAWCSFAHFKFSCDVINHIK